MPVEKIQQNEFVTGILRPFYAIFSLLGTSQTRFKILEANKHPRCRVECGTYASGGISLTHNTSGAQMTVEHDDTRDAATTSAGTSDVMDFEDFDLTSTKDADIFEADEDVYVLAATAAGNAADMWLGFVKFVPVEEDE